jgi:hypothetical protein
MNEELFNIIFRYTLKQRNSNFIAVLHFTVPNEREIYRMSVRQYVLRPS